MRVKQLKENINAARIHGDNENKKEFITNMRKNSARMQKEYTLLSKVVTVFKKAANKEDQSKVHEIKMLKQKLSTDLNTLSFDTDFRFTP